MNKMKKTFSDKLKDTVITLLLLGFLGFGFTEAIIAKGNTTKAAYINKTRLSTVQTETEEIEFSEMMPIMLVGLGFAILAFYTYRKKNEI